MDRIKAHYLIETSLAPESAAKSIAGEQSSGTFVKVPGETKELIERSSARVENVGVIESVAEPSLPGHRGTDGPYHRAELLSRGQSITLEAICPSSSQAFKEISTSWFSYLA